MALINRLSRLFTADVHAVLDRIEEPQVLLKQSLREMEEALAQNEQRVKWLRHEKDSLAARLDEIEQTAPQIEEELDVCFSNGADDLARALIKRRLKAERLASSLARKRDAARNTLAQETARLAEHRNELESLRQKAEIMTEDAGCADRDVDRCTYNLGVSDEEIEVAYLREKQRRTTQ